MLEVKRRGGVQGVSPGCFGRAKASRKGWLGESNNMLEIESRNSKKRGSRGVSPRV